MLAIKSKIDNKIWVYTGRVIYSEKVDIPAFKFTILNKLIRGGFTLGQLRRDFIFLGFVNGNISYSLLNMYTYTALEDLPTLNTLGLLITHLLRSSDETQPESWVLKEQFKYIVNTDIRLLVSSKKV